jgi:hypothetical protein
MKNYKNGWTKDRHRIGLAMQNGTCAICGGGGRLCMDHSHYTGEPRGLLCVKCNSGIGMFNDSPTLLINALRYLDRWHGPYQRRDY